MTARVQDLVQTWWPVLLAFLFAFAAAVEVRVQVAGLKDDKSVDQAQGSLLVEHEGRIGSLENFNTNNFSQLESDKRHWGAILDQWPKRLQQLDDHERRLIQIETLSGRPVGGE